MRLILILLLAIAFNAFADSNCLNDSLCANDSKHPAPSVTIGPRTAPWATFNSSGISFGVPTAQTLTAAHLFVGNAGNVATDTAVSGDCALSSVGALTCTKTNGTAFAASATLDTTNATNITTGILKLPNGSAAAPEYSFANTATSGLYYAGSSAQICTSSGGTQSQCWLGNQSQHPAGTPTGPTVVDLSNGVTGLYWPALHVMGIGDNQAGEIVRFVGGTNTHYLQIQPMTFAQLGAPANGTLAFCSDCTIANPCAGGGTGALAKRLAAAWVCN